MGPSGDPFLLFLFGRLAEKTLVIFHQFPHNQEYIDSCHTVGNQTGNIVTFGIAFTFDEGLVPQGSELRIVFLYLANQFILAETNLFKGAEMLDRVFLDGKHGA